MSSEVLSLLRIIFLIFTYQLEIKKNGDFFKVESLLKIFVFQRRFNFQPAPVPVSNYVILNATEK